MQGNYYFERYAAGAGGYRNARKARELLADCPTAVLAVAGHVHWNSWHCIDGIHHLTAQSLTETFTTYPEPAGAWARLLCPKNHYLKPRQSRQPFLPYAPGAAMAAAEPVLRIERHRGGAKS
jgi:hypothetical protein